jgi:hypothetical protein
LKNIGKKYSAVTACYKRTLLYNQFHPQYRRNPRESVRRFQKQMMQLKVGPKVCYSYNEYRNGCVKFFELLLIYLCIYLSIVDIFQDGFATASGMVDIWGEKGFFYALLMFSLACYYDITCINIGSL